MVMIELLRFEVSKISSISAAMILARREREAHANQPKLSRTHKEDSGTTSDFVTLNGRDESESRNEIGHGQPR